MNTRFSIIVVCYNAGKKLADTVDSILEQTYKDYEIIIKDGGSTDGSLSKVPADEKIHITSCKDAGIYDAMNQAIALAKEDYYLFLNCGDSFYCDKVLEEAAGKITDKTHETKGKKPLIYYGDTYNEQERTIIIMNPTITSFTCYRHTPCHQACFYAKKLFEERQYDISYLVRADYEHFLWSFFCKQANPQYLEMVVANYEGGGFSESKKNHKQDVDEHKRITEKYMTKRQLHKYRLIMTLTLVSFRRFLSRQKYFSWIYNKVKEVLYRS